VGCTKYAPAFLKPSLSKDKPARPMATVTPLMDLRLFGSMTFYDHTGAIRSFNDGMSAECHATPNGDYECEFNLDDLGYQVGYALNREHFLCIGLGTQIGVNAGLRLYTLADVDLSTKDTGELLDANAEIQIISRTAFMRISKHGRSKAASMEIKLVRVKKSVYVAGQNGARRCAVHSRPHGAVQEATERLTLYKNQLSARHYSRSG
jgi:hypothetical protein